MPWSSRQAPRTVRGKKKRRQWAKIANSCLASGRREGECKRMANATLKKQRDSR